MAVRGLVVGVLSGVLVLAGCAGGGDPAASLSSNAPIFPEHEQSIGAPDDCVVAERRAASNLGMWRVEIAVPYGPGTGSEVARDALTQLVERVGRRLQRKCSGVPAGFSAFATSLEQPLASEDFGQEQLAQVLASWLVWGESVDGARHARSAVKGQERCLEEFHPLVEATYDFTRTPTDTGTMWLLDVTFDNRTGRVLDGSMSGVIEGTGVQGDPFGGEGGAGTGRGRDRTLYWGGSSADFLELDQGVTTLRVAPEGDTDVHTTAEGQLEVVDFSASLAIRGEGTFCTVIAQPAV